MHSKTHDDGVFLGLVTFNALLLSSIHHNDLLKVFATCLVHTLTDHLQPGVQCEA